MELYVLCDILQDLESLQLTLEGLHVPDNNCTINCCCAEISDFACWAKWFNGSNKQVLVPTLTFCESGGIRRYANQKEKRGGNLRNGVLVEGLNFSVNGAFSSEVDLSLELVEGSVSLGGSSVIFLVELRGE